MYYVYFWKDGAKKTIAYELDTREYAYEWAREGLEKNKSYDKAVIYREDNEGNMKWYDTIRQQNMEGGRNAALFFVAQNLQLLKTKE